MNFRDRENAFETGFAEDQKNDFRIEARASRLIGYWAADKMGLTGEAKESYAKEVITANLDEPGYDDVKRKILKDLSGKNIIADNAELDTVIAKAVRDATEQMKSE